MCVILAVLRYKGLLNRYVFGIICGFYILNKECMNSLPCSVHTVSIAVL